MQAMTQAVGFAILLMIKLRRGKKKKEGTEPLTTDPTKKLETGNLIPSLQPKNSN